MSDKDFLEIFDKINDKFLVETYRDNEKRRRGSKRMFFHAAYTAAACIMVVAAAVLIVSSFIGRDEFIHPSSGAGESMSSNSLPESGDLSDNPSDGESSAIEPAPEVPVYENAVFIETVRFEFPESGREFSKELDFPAFYAEYQQQSVSALLTLTVRLTEDYADNSRVPMRMYLFSDGRQSLFQYDKANIPYLDLDLDFGTDDKQELGIDFSFYAGRSTNSVAAVCVLFPGDASRQTCFIYSACNLGSAESFGSMSRSYVENFVLDDDVINEMTYSNILTLNEMRPYDYNKPDSFWQRIVALGHISYGDPVKTVPVDSTGMYMHCSDVGSSYHLIALIDGEPAPVFDGEFFTTVEQYDNDLILYCKFPSEYLSENSTIQLIALPVSTYYLNWWGMMSECCLLSE